MTGDQDEAFRFSYAPSDVRFGRGSTAELGAELSTQDAERALVVTGRTVGTTPAVMDPIQDGLGDHLAEVFAETTPDKRLETAIDAARAMETADADAIVAVGGGSSLDVATVARVVAARERTAASLREELRERGTIAIPDTILPSLIAVPTTLAGAELSQVAGISLDLGAGEEPIGGSVSDPRLMPSAVLADPELFATTPAGVLTGSAMNGFDKAIETIYSKRATPFTDGTAVRALQLLVDGLPRMAADTADVDALSTVVRGTLLAQYGVSRPDGSTLSILHAFGHAIRDAASVQQGIAHAVVAPPALAYLLDAVDGRRELLAAGLGVTGSEQDAATVAAEVVDAVATLRDALGLPATLAAVEDVPAPTDSVLDAAADLVLADRLWVNAPAGLEPTKAEVTAVLRRAWGDLPPVGTPANEV